MRDIAKTICVSHFLVSPLVVIDQHAGSMSPLVSPAAADSSLHGSQSENTSLFFMQVSDWGGNHAEVSLVMRLLTGAEAGSTDLPKHQQQKNTQALRNARLTCTSWCRIVSCEREAWAPVTMAFYPHIARLQRSFQNLQVSLFVGAFVHVHASEHCLA